METNNLETLSLPYASLSRRFGAFLIDAVIVGILGAIADNIITFLGGLAVWFFYAPILESSEVRATIGKHLMGIQVSDLTGRRISFRASLVRNVLKLVSAAIVFIGFFFALFTKRKQTLHDMLADTVVVYGRSEAPIADAWVASSKEVFRAGQSALATPNSTSNSSPNSSASSSNQNESVVSQLDRLQNLRAQGAISLEEYESAKKKLLSTRESQGSFKVLQNIALWVLI